MQAEPRTAAGRDKHASQEAVPDNWPSGWFNSRSSGHLARLRANLPQSVFLIRDLRPNRHMRHFSGSGAGLASLSVRLASWQHDLRHELATYLDRSASVCTDLGHP